MDRAKPICGRALEIALYGFLLAIFVFAWGEKNSQASSLATPESNASGAASLLPQIGTVFDMCIVDDSNGIQLQLNTVNGDYIFTDCNAFTLGGTGLITLKGCVITLQHVTSDRRVTAKIDTCQKKAKASAQTFSPAATRTITDRNTADDACGCGDSVVGRPAP
jgi:hypothetical protein